MRCQRIKAAVLLLGAALQLVLSGCYARPRVSRPAPQTAAAASLPDRGFAGFTEGLAMKVKNWTPVSSASAMPGKKVSAQVVENVVVNGQVVVPRKSVLSGHIIEAQKKDTIHSEARLRIVYDSIRVRGKKMAFTGLIEKVSVEDSPPEEVTESDCFTAPPSNPFPDRSDPLPSSSSQHCMTRSYISSDPTSGDDISFAGFVDDNTGQGVVIVSERNIRISWQTRFTVRVASPPHVVN